MRRVDEINLAAVARIGLTYEAGKLSSGFYKTALRLKDGRAVSLTSISWSGLAQSNNQVGAYRDFVAALIEAVSRASPQARLEAGKPRFVWAAMAATTGALALAALYIAARAFMAGAIGAALVPLALGAVMIWQMGPVVRRNRPRPFTADALPDDLLGGAVSPGASGVCDDEAVELGADPDLAGQARGRPDVGGEVEHVLLHRRGRADHVLPFLVDIDVAGGAGAGAAAFGDDAGHVVADRGLHDGRALLRLDLARGAVLVDVGDLDHRRSPEDGEPPCPRRRAGRSLEQGFGVGERLGRSAPARSATAARASASASRARARVLRSVSADLPWSSAVSSVSRSEATRQAPTALAAPLSVWAASAGPRSGPPRR